MLVNYSKSGVCYTNIFHIGITHNVIVSSCHASDPSTDGQTEGRSADRRAAGGRNGDGQSVDRRAVDGRNGDGQSADRRTASGIG